MTAPILVAGAGSWGTALAVLLARNGHATLLWGHDPAHIACLSANRRNDRYLRGVEFPPSLMPTDELEEALADVRDVIIAVPCAALREVAHQVATHARPHARIAWACKGIDKATLQLPHQIIAELFGNDCPAAVVSGPTFANEVAAGLPAAVVVASTDSDYARALAARLHGAAFRAYVGDDVVGVEIGGAVKNVLAIAAGISDGLGLGANSRAAVVTRGLAELTRLGVTLGARRDTFMGLAGLGDLVLTCTQDQSRNRRLGLAIAGGRSVDEAVTDIGQVVEGVRTAEAVRRLAHERTIEMPICEQVARVLSGESEPRDAVRTLLARELKAEGL